MTMKKKKKKKMMMMKEGEEETDWERMESLGEKERVQREWRRGPCMNEKCPIKTCVQGRMQRENEYD